MSMTGITGSLAGALTPLLVAVTAAAQTTPPLEAIDQQIEDVSALGLSLREVQTSLRHPNTFSELYRSPMDDDHLARIQGGLYAVFPRSTYEVNNNGSVFPGVPAGTVFYIGPPPRWILSAIDTAASHAEADSARIEGRLAQKIAPGLLGGLMGGLMEGAIPALQAPGPGPESQRLRHNVTGDNTLPAVVPANRMVFDPEYRARRMHALMHDAAEASRPHTAR